MESITYDPRTKQQIKDLLFSYIYDPIQTKLKDQLVNITKKNSVLMCAGHLSFVYKGEFYTCDEHVAPRFKTRLHPKLVPLMEAYLKEVKKLNTEELPYVLGFIQQTLNASNNLNDYLRIFPEFLHLPIHRLIMACPCRNKQLDEEDVKHLQSINKKSIEMIKYRMVSNLIT